MHVLQSTCNNGTKLITNKEIPKSKPKKNNQWNDQFPSSKSRVTLESSQFWFYVFWALRNHKEKSFHAPEYNDAAEVIFNEIESNCAFVKRVIIPECNRYAARPGFELDPESAVIDVPSFFFCEIYSMSTFGKTFLKEQKFFILSLLVYFFYALKVFFLKDMWDE